jgi:lysophospholipase L1-like esterase
VRRASRIFLINLIVLVAGIAAVELCFGAWFGTWYDPRLRVIRNAEYKNDVRALYPARTPVVYRRDQWGLRGNFSDSGQINIVTIGGSTTDQRLIAEGATWQDRLAQRLAEMGHSAVIANAGIDGQSTVGHIVALQGWLFRIPRLHPRLVLIYAGINDVLLQYKTAYDAGEPSGAAQRIARYVQERSAILAFFNTAAGMIKAAHGHLPHTRIDFTQVGGNWIPLGDLSSLRDEYAARLDAYEGRLETLDRLIRAWGAIPVFITQPRADRRPLPDGGMVVLVRADGHTDPETRALSLFNERMLLFCRRSGDVCIDLAQNLALDLEDYYDFVHNTPGGEAKIGAYLAPQVGEVLTRSGLAENR